jgi:AcrR family transcriptional regulator
MNSGSENGRLGRKEREFLARRAEIMSAAMRLFASKGFHSTTMSEIAKEAEFSTGSLYNFFKSKEELYFTMLREEIEKVEARTREQRAKARSPREDLEAVVDTLTEYFEENRYVFQIFVTHREHFEWPMKGELAEVVRAKYLSFIGELVEVFKAGISQGLFKPYEPEELALCFMGILNSFIYLWINTETKVGLRDKKPVILDMFYRGVEQIRERGIAAGTGRIEGGQN